MATVTAVLLLSGTGCSNTSFSRYRGRALRFGIPLYQGTPPSQYAYRYLGSVTGEHKSRFSESSAFIISEALEDLANHAKLMGANAVIEVESDYEHGAFRYTGQAVIFDRLPEN